MIDFFEKRSVTCKPTPQNNFKIDDEDSDDEKIDFSKPLLLQEHTFVKKSKITVLPQTGKSGFFANKSNSVQLGCLSFGSLKRPKVALSQNKPLKITEEAYCTSDNEENKKKEKKKLVDVIYPKQRTKSESHAIEKEIKRDLQCKIFQTNDMTSKYKGTVFKKSTFLTLKTVSESSDHEDSDDDDGGFVTTNKNRKPVLKFGFGRPKLNFNNKK
jgi:hypothetical protein